MRGLKKSCMGRGHTNRQTDGHRDSILWKSLLKYMTYDQRGPVPANYSQTRLGVSLCYLSGLSLQGRAQFLVLLDQSKHDREPLPALTLDRLRPAGPKPCPVILLNNGTIPNHMMPLSYFHRNCSTSLETFPNIKLDTPVDVSGNRNVFDRPLQKWGLKQIIDVDSSRTLTLRQLNSGSRLWL